MAQKTYRLEIGGKMYEFAEGTTYLQIAEQLQDPAKPPVLLFSVNNRLRELYHKVSADGKAEFLTIQDPSGFKTYQRSLCMMMLKAIRDIAGDDPGYETSIHYMVSDGLYCTLSDPKKVTDEFIGAVFSRMQELHKQHLPIVKKNISTDHARQIFREMGMDDKDRLFRFRLSSRANMYELDGYRNYNYGYMAHNTSVLDKFALTRYEDGFVLRFPSMEEPDRVPEFDPVVKLFQVQKKSLEWGDMLGIFSVADLDERIVNGRAKELILTQEAYHEKQIASIAQEIAAHPKQKLVMIAGPSSSGKTTFSHRLSTQLSVYGLNPHPIAVDDYFVDREKTPRDASGDYDYECLEAIDVEQFNADMTRLLAGEEVSMPTYNFKTGKREYKGNVQKLGNRDILVIEGIHGLNDRLSYSLPPESKYRIYISALTQLNIDEHNRIPTTDGRLLRRIVRDARTRGISAQSTIARWPSVRRGEENNIFPFQERADVMFNSALIYELAVLKIYAEPLLYSIDPLSREFAEAKRLIKFLNYFVPMAPEGIPMNSLVREFIGGSCFDV